MEMLTAPRSAQSSHSATAKMHAVPVNMMAARHLTSLGRDTWNRKKLALNASVATEKQYILPVLLVDRTARPSPQDCVAGKRPRVVARPVQNKARATLPE